MTNLAGSLSNISPQILCLAPVVLISILVDICAVVLHKVFSMQPYDYAYLCC